MTGSSIPKIEFERRIDNVREKMQENDLDILFVYGDEFRRENLRYLSNYWPIFERGILALGLETEPITVTSPECQHLAEEMSVWKDIRIVKELGMSYVPEEVSFENVTFTNFKDIIKDITKNNSKLKLGVCGHDAMSEKLYRKLAEIITGVEFSEADDILYSLRLIKSPIEIGMLKKAWQICDTGFKAVLDTDIVGLTEIQAAAIGEKAARDAGAEHIVFSNLCSGERTNTVIGRQTEKIIEDGDMVMTCLCVQYQGYVASTEWPFVAGKKKTIEQMDLIKHLVTAENIGIEHLKNGVISGELVRTVKKYFIKNDLSKYDLYPPMHGNGLSEAESPYPDENSTYPLKTGMGVNFDVSLFNYPNAGSNRIEEGFIITDNGVEPLSGLVDSLRKNFLE